MPMIAEFSSSNAAANPTHSLFPIPTRTQPATTAAQLAAQPKSLNSAPAASATSADSPYVGAWMQGDAHWTRCVRSQRRPSWIARTVMDLFFNWNWVERQL